MLWARIAPHVDRGLEVVEPGDHLGDFEVTEDDPLAPTSPYARTKRMIEQVLEDMAVATDLRAIILRYFNPIGSDPDLESGIYAKEPSHVLGQLVMAARGQKDSFTITGTEHPTRDGTGIRDYIHVWDLARAHVRAVERFDQVLAEAGGPSVVINVGRGDGVTVRELVAAFERVFGHDVPDHRGSAASGRRRRRLRQRRPGAPSSSTGAPSSPSTRPSRRRWRGATAARKSWATSDPPVRRLTRRRGRRRVGGSGGAGLGRRHDLRVATPAARWARACPLSGRTVVIDPGHQLGNHRFPAQINRLVPAGGFEKPCNTTGTATNAGYPEATFAWQVARLLRHRLEALGATVRADPPLQQRATAGGRASTSAGATATSSPPTSRSASTATAPTRRGPTAST